MLIDLSGKPWKKFNKKRRCKRDADVCRIYRMVGFVSTLIAIYLAFNHNP